MQSIFRYPGGKSRSSAQQKILRFAPENYAEYREPFVGGGGIFFAVDEGNEAGQGADYHQLRGAVMTDDVLNADEYANWSIPPREAGILIADEWMTQRTKAIDLWSCDYYGETFWMSFLGRCKENGCLEAARDIEWHWGCEMGNMGESFSDKSAEWSRRFLAESEVF